MRIDIITRAALIALGAGLATSAHAQPLAADPDLVTGRLGNGLRYIVLDHANPPGRVNLLLHFSTGSLNETEETRGIAHFLEHMAFNGGEHIPPGEVVPYFESLAMSFGQHLNAFTTFDQTAYTLSLPDTQIDTLEKGFLFFEDALYGLLLSAEEIDKERGVILEEMRTGKGPDQRIMDQIFERIAPGSTFGRRLPIGTEETVNSVSRDDFVAYYSHFYVPSNATLIVVGDFDDTAPIVESIRETFDRGEAVPTPEDRAVGVEAYTELRAIVATDPELADADVGLIGIEKPADPVTTEEGFRRQMVEGLAGAAFSRRLDAKINDDKVTFTDANAFVGDLFNAMRVSQLSVSGAPEDWRQMFGEITTELRRARLHGFTQRELDDVRKQLIAGAERSAERFDTLPARARVNMLNGAVAEGSTPIDADTRLELTRKYADTVTLDELNEAFNSLYSDTRTTAIVELPSTADVPTEGELLALAREALSVTPEAEAETDRPTELLSELPAGGKVVDSATDEASGVSSAWLSNNVRLHHRFMDIQKEQAQVIINLAAGEILEDASTRGFSEAAALAWNRPAVEGLSANNIRDLMTGKKVSVSGAAGSDTMTISVAGSPAELEAGMQLAYLLLSRPVIERAAFDQWKQERVLQIQQSKMVPQGQVMEAMSEALLPEGEPRRRPLTVEQVERITLDDAQAWLDRIIATAPIEVAVVGDIGQDRAVELVSRYVGSLPARARINAKTLDEYRTIHRPSESRTVIKKVETQTPLAIALAGSFGASMDDVRDRRALNVAAQILTTRLIERVREVEAQVYSISAQSVPGTDYPELGLVFAASATGPANGERLASVIHEMFEEFAENGPSADEVAVARDQVLNSYDEQIKQPQFWGALMSVSDYMGRPPSEAIEAPEMYNSMDEGVIQGVFRKYYTPDTRITVIVAPKGADGAGALESDG